MFPLFSLIVTKVSINKLIMYVFSQIKKFRAYIILAIAVVITGGIALFYGTNYAMVRGVSSAVIEVPSYISDKRAVKEYLGLLFLQYLGDTSLPSAVAAKLEIVLSNESNIEIGVAPEGVYGNSFRITLKGRGYDVTARLLKSTIEHCNDKLASEVAKIGRQIVREQERELLFLKKYVDEERKQKSRKLSTSTRYEQQVYILCFLSLLWLFAILSLS